MAAFFGTYMKFDDSFFIEEIRSDHLITTKYKKIWKAELEILELFDNICRNNNLKYYAAYGTLLGAIRHEGMIPWDDDIDVYMFRDDYNRFLSIAKDSLSEPYELQNAYNCDHFWPFSKIRNKNTTAIEFTNYPKDFNQGIFIDIFPLDDIPENSDDNVYQMQKEVWMTIVSPERVTELLNNNFNFLLGKDFLSNLLKLPYRQRYTLYEGFCSQHYGRANLTGVIPAVITQNEKPFQKEWFEKTVYKRFENDFMIPVPYMYEELLVASFGDWRTPVKGASAHNIVIFDADKPYHEYL